MSKDVVHTTKNIPALNKRQVSIVQQHHRRQRLILLVGIIVICCAIVLTGYGVYDTRFKPWRETVLKVNSTPLSMTQYVARVRYILQTQGITEPRKYTSLSTLLPQLTDTLVNNELMLEAARELNINVTDQQVTEQLQKDVLPASSTGETPTGDFDALYKKRLKDYQLTDAEYREITRMNLMNRALVLDHINKEVADTAPQVHILVITVATEDEAKAIKERLDNGEDFATVAQEKSTDSLAQSGGDAGWFAHDVLSTDIADVIFNLNAGEISQPVPKSDGSAYYIFKVSEKEDARKLDENNLNALQAKHLEDWLTQKTYSSVITNNLTSEKYTWITQHI